jgi:hypothetical protein
MAKMIQDKERVSGVFRSQHQDRVSRGSGHRNEDGLRVTITENGLGAKGDLQYSSCPNASVATAYQYAQKTFLVHVSSQFVFSVVKICKHDH